MKRAMVEIPGSFGGMKFDALVEDVTWNGWQTPWMQKSEVMKLCICTQDFHSGEDDKLAFRDGRLWRQSYGEDRAKLLTGPISFLGFGDGWYAVGLGWCWELVEEKVKCMTCGREVTDDSDGILCNDCLVKDSRDQIIRNIERARKPVTSEFIDGINNYDVKRLSGMTPATWTWLARSPEQAIDRFVTSEHDYQAIASEHRYLGVLTEASTRKEWGVYDVGIVGDPTVPPLFMLVLVRPAD